MAAVTMRQLLEAGIHFGHQTRRWNPKMKRFIFGERNGIYIIDLQKTMRQVNEAYKTIVDVVSKGGNVLFVGTKKQAREPIEQEARRCNMFYVNNRWLGGTLTNWATIRQSVSSLLRLEEMESSGKIDEFPKKEGIKLRKQQAKLNKNLCGIKLMESPPALMFVVDVKREAIAVREAERLGIPCIAIVDTNSDPDVVPYPVPGNDDAIRALNLFCSIMADAVIEGRAIAEKLQAEKDAEAKAEGESVAPPADEPTAGLAEPEQKPAAEQGLSELASAALAAEATVGAADESAPMDETIASE